MPRKKITPPPPIDHQPTNTQKVTRPPPYLSDTQPVAARERPDQRADEGELQRVDLGKLRLREQREAGGIADEAAEGAGVEPAHDPVVLAAEDDRLLGERRLASAMSFMPNQAAKAVAAMMNGTQMKPAFCIHICPPSVRPAAGRPAAEHARRDDERHQELHDADTPRLPRPALSASALPFSALGKKKLMFAIDEAKLPPPSPHSSASVRKIR
jgi:hypothetical protein